MFCVNKTPIKGKRKKTPSINVVKEKLKYHCRTKVMYLNRSNFSYIGCCNGYSHVETQSLFYATEKDYNRFNNEKLIT